MACSQKIEHGDNSSNKVKKSFSRRSIAKNLRRHSLSVGPTQNLCWNDFIKCLPNKNVARSNLCQLSTDLQIKLSPRKIHIVLT